jgi:WD40 repeat protein
LIVETNDEGKIYLANIETKRFLPVSKDALLSEGNWNPDLGLITKTEEIQALGFRRIPSILSILPDGETLILEDGLFDLQEKALIDVFILEGRDLSLTNNLADGNMAIIDLPKLPSFKKVLKGTLTIITLDPKDFSAISKQPINFELPDGIEDATLSPDGSILVVGLLNGSVYFWDTKTGEQMATIRAHNKVFGLFGYYGSINDIKFSRDGLLIATVGRDKTIKIWRTADFSLVSTLYGSIAAFSPDSTSLAIVDSSNRIQVQSLLEETPPVVFEGHTKDVTELLFSADGSLVISGSRDETIKIWSIADKALQLDLPQYDVVYSLVLSPDGTRLYSWAGDGVISVWGYSAP